MRYLAALVIILLPLPLLADPLECLPEGTVEQIAEQLPPGSILYRDCYFCQSPAYEVIKIEKTELRPCHLHDLPAERALYVTGTVERRFKMEKCGEPKEEEQVQRKLSGELVVLNYAWLYDKKTGEATNIADRFGETSHHRCQRFIDRTRESKTRPAKKFGG